MLDIAEVFAGLTPQQQDLLVLRLSKAEKKSASRVSITPHTKEERVFPLLFSQEHLWMLDQLEPGNPAYNLSGAIRLIGVLDVSALMRSFNEIVRRHEILRTTFSMNGEHPVQRVAPELKVPLPIIDLGNSDDVHDESELSTLISAEVRRPFDLALGPLLRTTLLRLSPNEHIVILALHHIVYDGWSSGVLIHELATLYDAFSADKPSPLPALPVQYADFAVWQRRWLQGEVLSSQVAYWKKQLGQEPADLSLQTKRTRPSIQTFSGAHQSIVLSKPLTDALKVLSQHEGVTLFMTLMSAFNVLLYRSTNQVDLIVATGIANRKWVEVESLIGFFVNTLMIRTDLSRSPTFRELLSRVRKVVLEAYAHQDLPVEKLIQELQIKRDPSRHPITQVAFTFQNSPSSALQLSELKMQPLDVSTGTAKFDLELFMGEEEDHLTGRLEYNTDLFDAPDAARILRQFETLLGSIVAQPGGRISTLELRDESERIRQATEQEKEEESNRFKLKNARRRTISPTALVQMSYPAPDERLPLVVQPAVKDVNLIVWIGENRSLLEKELLTHGAVLFRNFHIGSAAEFERTAMAFSPHLLEYGERSTPRSTVIGNVYTSTEYPADQHITLHNEHSYSNTWPMKLWFFCSKPAESGGETPIADSRKVFTRIAPEIRERFIQKRVMYVRNYGTSLDLPWQNVFQTDNPSEVESYCRGAGIHFEWLGGTELRTRQVCQAVAVHPRTGETVWFNQAHLFHVSNLESSVQESLLAVFKEEGLSRNAYYGDGTRIERSVLDEIRAAYQASTVTFPWQKDDLLMLDNMLVAHGRRPYTGERKTLVAMAEQSAVKNL